MSVFLSAVVVAAGSFFFAGDAEDDPHTVEDAAPSAAYTLDDEWDEQWLQIFDRSGRPDPDGPMLQRFDGNLYRRFHFDINVPDFPLSTEGMWVQQEHGVRLWVQSLNEQQLANRLQMRTNLSAWEGGHLGIRYDRRQDRITDRHLFRFQVEQRDIASSGVDAALRIHPKWDKTDVDVELLVRRDLADVGTAGLRIGLLDPFINAAFGLLEARELTVDEHIRQRDIPLALGAQLQSATFAGLRSELYTGVVVPHERRHRVLGLTCTGAAVMTGELPLPKAVRESVERAYRTVPRNSTVTRYGQNSPTLKSTLELTRQGLSPAEVARRRGLATSTVVEHIYALIGHGADIDLEPHVDPDLLAELTELNCRWKPGDSPVPVVEQLDTEVDWGELKLHLLHLFLSSKQGEEQTRRGA